MNDTSGLDRYLGERRWVDVIQMLTTPAYLEARVEAGQAFELAEDILAALEVVPVQHPGRRQVQLLAEALLRDLHFITRHPETLFQCLWNSCWWYDCPQAASFYQRPAGNTPVRSPPWEAPEPRLSAWMERWRAAREAEKPGLAWVRSLRPAVPPLGGGQRVVIPVQMPQRRRLQALYLAADGRLVAWWGPNPRTVQAWEARTGRPAADFTEDTYPFRDLSSSPDARWQVACGGEGGGWGKPVRLRDTERGAEIAAFDVSDDVNIICAAVSWDGRLIAAGGYGEESEGHLLLWDVSTRKSLPAPGMLSHGVWAVAISHDGRPVAAGLEDGSIELWEIGSGLQLSCLTGHGTHLNALAFSGDGRQLASAGGDGTIRVQDLPASEVSLHRHGHPDGIVDAVFSTDGQRIVTLSANGTTWLWNGQTGSPVAHLHASDGVVLLGGCGSGTVFVDSERVISLAGRGQGVWEASSGRRLSDRPGGQAFFGSAAVTFAPTGERFAVVPHDSANLTLYKTGEAASGVDLAGHDGPIHDFAFSRDGQRLVSGSEDGTIRVWDVAEGRQLVCFRGHEGAVTCVAFSPDGRRVVSGGVDRTVRIQDIKLRQMIVSLVVPDAGVWRSGWSSQGHEITEGFLAVAFGANGEHLVTLSLDRPEGVVWGGEPRIRIWDPWSGQCLRTLEGDGDLKAIASSRALCALLRGHEVVIESAAGNTVGVFPCPPSEYTTRRVVTAPSGRVWVVLRGRDFQHFVLEGGLDSAAG
jgi:WD40 repeat protein